MDWAQFRQLITQHFDIEELRTLCFDLDIDYDDLRGDGKPAKVRELVAQFKRNDRLPELVAALNNLRPPIHWDQILQYEKVAVTTPIVISGRRWLWSVGGLVLFLAIAALIWVLLRTGGEAERVSGVTPIVDASSANQVAGQELPVVVTPTTIAVEATTVGIIDDRSSGDDPLLNSTAIQEYLDAAWIYFDAGQYEEVITAANAVLEREEDARAYDLRALGFRALGNIEQAVADLSTAISLDPERPLYYIDRSITYAQYSGEAAAALQDGNTCVELAPENSECYLVRGNAFSLLGDFWSALTDLDQAIALDPMNPHLYGGRAGAHVGLGDVETSLSDITRAIELAPDYADFYVFRANTYIYEVMDYEAALADAQQCTVHDPDLAICYYFQAVSQRNLSGTNEAVTAFQNYLERIVPDDCPVCQAEARAYVAQFGESE